MTRFRFFALGLLALALLAFGIGFAPASGSATPLDPDASADDAVVFDMSVALDQEQKTLTVQLVDGLPGAPGMFEATVLFRVGESLQESTTTIPFALDAFGGFQAVIPVAYDSVVTNYELYVTACHVRPDGKTVKAATRWALGNKRVEDFGDIESISPMAYAALAGVEDDAAEDSPSGQALESLLMGGADAPDSGAPSFMFASETTGPDGEFLLSGPGNYLATAPVASFRATGGPAGVFTAN